MAERAKGKPRGPPPHRPSDRERAKVLGLVIAGRTHAEIGAMMGLSADTLQRHYRPELREARETLDATIAGTLVAGALGLRRGEKPDPKLQMFYAERRMGWRAVEPPPVPEFDYALLPPEERRLLAELLRKAQIRPAAAPAAPAENPDEPPSV